MIFLYKGAYYLRKNDLNYVHVKWQLWPWKNICEKEKKLVGNNFAVCGQERNFSKRETRRRLQLNYFFFEKILAAVTSLIKCWMTLLFYFALAVSLLYLRTHIAKVSGFYNYFILVSFTEINVYLVCVKLNILLLCYDGLFCLHIKLSIVRVFIIKLKFLSDAKVSKI